MNINVGLVKSKIEEFENGLYQILAENKLDEGVKHASSFRNGIIDILIQSPNDLYVEKREFLIEELVKKCFVVVDDLSYRITLLDNKNHKKKLYDVQVFI